MIFSHKAVTSLANICLGAFFNDNLDVDALAHRSKLPCLLISTSTSGISTSTPRSESGTALEWPLGLGALPGLAFLTFVSLYFQQSEMCISSLFRLSQVHSWICAWVVSSSQLTCTITAQKALKLHQWIWHHCHHCHCHAQQPEKWKLLPFSVFFNHGKDGLCMWIVPEKERLSWSKS